MRSVACDQILIVVIKSIKLGSFWHNIDCSHKKRIIIRLGPTIIAIYHLVVLNKTELITHWNHVWHWPPVQWICRYINEALHLHIMYLNIVTISVTHTYVTTVIVPQASVEHTGRVTLADEEQRKMTDFWKMLLQLISLRYILLATEMVTRPLRRMSLPIASCWGYSVFGQPLPSWQVFNPCGKMPYLPEAFGCHRSGLWMVGIT